MTLSSRLHIEAVIQQRSAFTTHSSPLAFCSALEILRRQFLINTFSPRRTFQFLSYLLWELTRSSSPEGITSVSFTLGRECDGGCSATLVVVAPNDSLDDLTELVPTSALYSRMGPASFLQSISIPVETTTPPLQVNLSVTSNSVLNVQVHGASSACTHIYRVPCGRVGAVYNPQI